MPNWDMFSATAEMRQTKVSPAQAAMEGSARRLAYRTDVPHAHNTKRETSRILRLEFSICPSSLPEISFLLSSGFACHQDHHGCTVRRPMHNGPWIVCVNHALGSQVLDVDTVITSASD